MRFVTKRGFLWGLLILGIFFLSIFWWHFPAWPNNLLTFLQGHPQLFITPGALLVIGLLFIALWGIPKWQVASLQLEAKERAELENEVRKTLAEIIGGVVILAGLYFSWETLKETRQEAKVNQDNARETLRIAQEGQITERFTKAIDQLGESGEEKLAMRLGGIYALERIARDSKRDHWPIMEVLTAYVREVAAWKESQALTGSKDKRPKERKLQRVDPPPRPTTDIQAILTVIGQRKREYDKDKFLDLTRTDLRGANLRDAHLEGAILADAHLEGAHLEGAHLADAHLEGADLAGADLVHAILVRATLESATLESANLVNATLESANLMNANLMNANLEIATLASANLADATLASANLESANLMNAILENANLVNANLASANLRGSYLGGASGLTIEQLSRVETLYKAILDDSLAEGIKKNFPHLLKNPDAK